MNMTEEGRSFDPVKPIRVAVLTPSAALRGGLRQMLALDERLEVTLAGTSLIDLPGEDETPADILILTPGALRGADRHALPWPARQLPVLILVEDRRSELPDLPLEPGQPWGLLPLDAEAEALTAAVHALSEGLAVAPPDWLVSRRDRRADGTDEGGDLAEALTPRETEVLGQLALGLTNKQIALALRISEHTVKYHISSIYAKLGAMNRAEAVRVGVRRGWIEI
jgi:DNA-binding NarL/FixJ family response regulator